MGLRTLSAIPPQYSLAPTNFWLRMSTFKPAGLREANLVEIAKPVLGAKGAEPLLGCLDPAHQVEILIQQGFCKSYPY